MDAVSNATIGVAGFVTDSSWFGIFFIVASLGLVLSFLIAAISSVQRFKKLKGIIKFLVDSFNYFLIGIAALVVMAIPAGLIYWEIKNASEGNVAPITWTIYLVGGYAAISFIGYLAKKLVNRIKRLNKLAKDK